MARSYMEDYRNYFYNLKRYGLNLSSKEIKGSIITILVTAFVFSFRDWGDNTFNFLTGLMNFGIAALLAAIALFWNQLGQRLIGVYYGYDTEYEASSIGIMLSLVVAFASRGYLVFIMPGYVVVHMLAASRLGEFRYYTNLWEWAKTLWGGPLFNFLFACFVKIVLPMDVIIFKKLLLMNIFFAVYSLVPMPNNPGMFMFWYHKYFWGFACGFIIGGCALLWFTNGWIALIGACICGLIAIWSYFISSDGMLNFK
ncbi:MAG: hypothetical protein V1859_08895 [archaeon]